MNGRGQLAELGITSESVGPLAVDARGIGVNGHEPVSKVQNDAEGHQIEGHQYRAGDQPAGTPGGQSAWNGFDG